MKSRPSATAATAANATFRPLLLLPLGVASRVLALRCSALLTGPRHMPPALPCTASSAAACPARWPAPAMLPAALLPALPCSALLEMLAALRLRQLWQGAAKAPFPHCCHLLWQTTAEPWRCQRLPQTPEGRCLPAAPQPRHRAVSAVGHRSQVEPQEPSAQPCITSAIAAAAAAAAILSRSRSSCCCCCSCGRQSRPAVAPACPRRLAPNAATVLCTLCRRVAAAAHVGCCWKPCDASSWRLCPARGGE